MPHIIPGIGYQRSRPGASGSGVDHFKVAKMLGQVMKDEEVIGGRQVKHRRSSPHGPHQQPERELRNKIIDYLEMYGVKCWWVENRAYMNRANRRRRVGFPDLFVICERKKWCGFFELKASIKDIPTSGPQWEFAQSCKAVGMEHRWVTCMEDIMFLVDDL